MESLQLVLVQVAGGTERMDPRPPERLVRIDVPHAGGGALVEEGGLDRGAPSIEAQQGSPARLGSAALPCCWARYGMSSPGSSRSHVPGTSDIAIDDIRSVV